MKVPDFTEELLESLQETEELECKLANGADGRGKLPGDFWPTYSAFANTHGGVVVLGIRERNGEFDVQGVPDTDRVISELFNLANNPEKVSANLLTREKVSVRLLHDRKIILIEVPAAGRKLKPVYLNKNPLNGNTYRRLHNSDCRCDDATVRRMLAEQLEDERDARIIPKFNWDDIDPDTFSVYRQLLRTAKPSLPWLELSDWELLGRLNGWRRDRQSGEEGLTLAGLAMFGRWESIQEGLPNFFLDYQERPEARAESRWVDRIVPDGTWPGNVFTFYRRVYQKLVSELKIPFTVINGQRKDDTVIHQAVREALVNSLVHADYTIALSVLVVKRPDMFGFRNPGGMRVSISQARGGGVSDCRNRIMHQLFLMIGLGERAGSGVPRIFKGWEAGHWRPPALYERDDPEQTLLALRMIDLLPEEVIAELNARFGKTFDSLSKLERLILATAASERIVSHNRILMISSEGARDLTAVFSRLVQNGFLEQSGKGRGTVYHLPGAGLPLPDDVFGDENTLSSVPILVSEGKDSISEGKGVISEGNDLLSEGKRDRDVLGRRISKHLNLPVIDDLSMLTSTYLESLELMADEPRSNSRISRDRMTQILQELCNEQFITLSALAALVCRSPDALRQGYLRQLVKDQILTLAFPSKPNDKRQAYTAILETKTQTESPDSST